METKLQEWLMENKPSDKMLYKNRFWDTYIFLREEIIPIFSNNKHSNKSYDELIKHINSYTDIVGTHMSKSIIHPVIRIIYKGVHIVFRYNFCDYEIAVLGIYNVNIPRDLFYSSPKDFFYYQGFPEEYKVTERYTNNHHIFIAGVGNKYKFYTFMYLLKHEIDKERVCKEFNSEPDYITQFGVGSFPVHIPESNC